MSNFCSKNDTINAFFYIQWWHSLGRSLCHLFLYPMSVQVWKWGETTAAAAAAMTLWARSFVQFSAVGKSDHRSRRDKCSLCPSVQRWGRLTCEIVTFRAVWQPWKVNYRSGNPEEWIKCKSARRWRLLAKMSSCWVPRGDWSWTRSGHWRRGRLGKGGCSGQGKSELWSESRILFFLILKNLNNLGLIKCVGLSNFTLQLIHI